MTEQRLTDAIRAALNVLGTGECQIVKKACPGCHWETKEAIGILRNALEIPLDEPETTQERSE
jgi:hypothetical protein